MNFSIPTIFLASVLFSPWASAFPITAGAGLLLSSGLAVILLPLLACFAVARRLQGSQGSVKILLVACIVLTTPALFYSADAVYTQSHSIQAEHSNLYPPAYGRINVPRGRYLPDAIARKALNNQEAQLVLASFHAPLFPISESGSVTLGISESARLIELLSSSKKIIVTGRADVYQRWIDELPVNLQERVFFSGIDSLANYEAASTASLDSYFSDPNDIDLWMDGAKIWDLRHDIVFQTHGFLLNSSFLSINEIPLLSANVLDRLFSPNKHNFIIVRPPGEAPGEETGNPRRQFYESLLSIASHLKSSGINNWSFINLSQYWDKEGRNNHITPFFINSDMAMTRFQVYKLEDEDIIRFLCISECSQRIPSDKIVNIDWLALYRSEGPWENIEKAIRALPSEYQYVSVKNDNLSATIGDHLGYIISKTGKQYSGFLNNDANYFWDLENNSREWQPIYSDVIDAIDRLSIKTAALTEQYESSSFLSARDVYRIWWLIAVSLLLVMFKLDHPKTQHFLSALTAVFFIGCAATLFGEISHTRWNASSTGHGILASDLFFIGKAQLTFYTAITLLNASIWLYLRTRIRISPLWLGIASLAYFHLASGPQPIYYETSYLGLNLIVFLITSFHLFALNQYIRSFNGIHHHRCTRYDLPGKYKMTIDWCTNSGVLIESQAPPELCGLAIAKLNPNRRYIVRSCTPSAAEEMLHGFFESRICDHSEIMSVVTAIRDCIRSCGSKPDIWIQPYIECQQQGVAEYVSESDIRIEYGCNSVTEGQSSKTRRDKTELWWNYLSKIMAAISRHYGAPFIVEFGVDGAIVHIFQVKLLPSPPGGAPNRVTYDQKSIFNGPVNPLTGSFWEFASNGRLVHIDGKLVTQRFSSPVYVTTAEARYILESAKYLLMEPLAGGENTRIYPPDFEYASQIIRRLFRLSQSIFTRKHEQIINDFANSINNGLIFGIEDLDPSAERFSEISTPFNVAHPFSTREIRHYLLATCTSIFRKITLDLLRNNPQGIKPNHIPFLLFTEIRELQAVRLVNSKIEQRANDSNSNQHRSCSGADEWVRGDLITGTPINLDQLKNLQAPTPGLVLMAPHVPSSAIMSIHRVQGVITLEGNRLSHLALSCRALNIPYLIIRDHDRFKDIQCAPTVLIRR